GPARGGARCLRTAGRAGSLRAAGRGARLLRAPGRRARLLRTAGRGARLLLRPAALRPAALRRTTRGVVLVGSLLRPGARPASLVHAALESVHQAEHLATLGLALLLLLALLAEGGLRVDRLTLLELLVEQGVQLLLVLISELLGIEVIAELLDQRPGHLHLLRLRLRSLAGGGEVDLPQVLGPAHGLQHHQVVMDAEHRQPGLGAQG